MPNEEAAPSVAVANNDEDREDAVRATVEADVKLAKTIGWCFYIESLSETDKYL